MTGTKRIFSLLMGVSLLWIPSLAEAQRPPTMPPQQFQAQAYQDQQAAAPQDAVEMIRQQYSAYFSDLPPSRKCTPADAQGVWKEYAIYESAGQKEVLAQKAEGPKYLVSGLQYNQALWLRYRNAVSVQGAMYYVNKSPRQYIMTAAGMLYFYQGGKLETSLICSVTTARTAKFETGMLMLALPVEKDKSLTISLYAPLR